MNGRALLTGGAGFIGSHVADRLAGEGLEVILLDNFVSGTEGNISGAIEKGNVRVVRGSVLDRDLLASLASGVSMICRLAALPEVRLGQENPEEVWSVNVEGTRALLEAMRVSGGNYDHIRQAGREGDTT